MKSGELWGLRVRTFLLPKWGYSLQECEDAVNERCWHCGAMSIERTEGCIARKWVTKKSYLPARFAISDGATEASDSFSWAKLLVDTWKNGVGNEWGEKQSGWTEDAFLEEVKKAGERFSQAVLSATRPWFAQAKAASGAFAAFIGIEIFADRTWKALAIGDCCLFQERNEELLVKFPITAPEHFNSHPVLMPSLPSKIERVSKHLDKYTGCVENGDRIWLMSDALAQWFLDSYKRSKNDFLKSLEYAVLQDDIKGCTSKLVALIKEERLAKKLRNDDVALVIVEVI